MPVKCKWCQIAFIDKAQLQQHLQQDVEKHTYFCTRCQHTFKTFKQLKEHFTKSSRHDTEDPYEMMVDRSAYCTPCRRQFGTPEQLVAHETKTHNDRLLCAICEIWFRTESNLQQHMSSPVHNVRNIACPHCQALFKTTSGVAHHLEFKCLKKITEGLLAWDVERKITNPYIGNPNVVEDRDRIREVDSDDDEDTVLVMRRRPGIVTVINLLADGGAYNRSAGAYVCLIDDCPRQFRKLGHLNQHLKSQVHQADPDTFRCPGCQSKFSVVSALIQHLESGSCGLVGQAEVKTIYTGMVDMFKRLLAF